MILDFSITNFKSFKDTKTISFEATKDTHLEDYFVIKKDKYRILKINTILGANASGKSNVLKAFKLLKDLILYPCKDKSEFIDTDTFALDLKSKEKDTVFKLNFLCEECKYSYEVKFNNTVISYESLTAHPFGELRSHEVFTRETNPDTKVSNLKLGSKYQSVKVNNGLIFGLFHNRTVFGAFQNSNVDAPWLAKLVDWTENFLMPNVTTDDQGLTMYSAKLISESTIKKETVAEILNKADVGICDFNIEKEEEKIPVEIIEQILKDNKAPEKLKQRLKDNPVSVYYKLYMIHAGEGIQIPFDYDNESNGTKRYFELSGILVQLIEKTRFVAIDELENKLHPDLYMHFVMTYLRNAKESQLLFTTHIREFLNDKDTFRDDSVWLTEKSEIGATDLYSLADFDSGTLRDSTNRANAYRSGSLGGIPKLSDVYITNFKEDSTDGKTAK